MELLKDIKSRVTSEDIIACFAKMFKEKEEAIKLSEHKKKAYIDWTV